MRTTHLVVGRNHRPGIPLSSGRKIYLWTPEPLCDVDEWFFDELVPTPRHVTCGRCLWDIGSMRRAGGGRG